MDISLENISAFFGRKISPHAKHVLAAALKFKGNGNNAEPTPKGSLMARGIQAGNAWMVRRSRENEGLRQWMARDGAVEGERRNSRKKIEMKYFNQKNMAIIQK
ncbi:hypothetical protein [Herbaspirillum rubrisubalbicans]|uniref:hypothetical protein n=1 Tax=Herbaspirillum rubrisubalbicans TaxID=80842 RepID=UPI0015C578F5|nr:hypothetical protein [Herbaspirillum rubrisubalbicans]NQE47540.1 hypothetical protein [Herbaspirillum rubrisubalbicans]